MLSSRRRNGGSILRVDSEDWKSISAGDPSGRISTLPEPRVSRCTIRR
jgi:hypothetical protein